MTNRKIKFKAYDKNRNKIVDIHYIDWHDFDEFGELAVKAFKTSNKTYYLEEGEYELLQYINKNDKNNVEIYEDDIIKHKEMRTMHDGFIWYTSRVPKLTAPFDIYLLFSKALEIEKIGNYYTNPELLTATAN